MNSKDEMRMLAAQVNDPNFAGDRWSTSMRLSILMRRAGARGVDGASDDSDVDAERADND